MLCNSSVHYSYGTNNFAARTTVFCNAWNWLRYWNYTGKALTFRLDSETGHVLRKGNWVSTIILLVILGAKIIIKQSMFSGSTHQTLMVVTNAFLCITLGNVISRRYYIWKKYNELTQKA